jgi:tRNA-dihydrouridine synthase B
MKIADYEIPDGAYLAPMAGITDVIFRNICKRYGAALTCTEMVSVQGLFYQPQKSLKLIRKQNEGPHIAQIFGSDPRLMACMAKKHLKDFDIIDINMGCPAPKIVKGGAGSALMKEPQKAADIVAAISGETGKPVTCKIRSGWDAGSVNAVDFSLGLQKAGAALITLHARTRDQYYSGDADWDLIKKLKCVLDIPVVGNGDVKNAQDAKRMMDYTGCDGVMVGRPAQGRPYIFRQIKDYLENGALTGKPDLKQRMADALEHAEGLSAIYGEKNAAHMMRKHLAWYIRGEHDAARLRNMAVKVDSLAQIREFINGVIRRSEINT